ncbi:high affinity cationic amino acid transporter 1-like isoform X1 [Dermacentor andersoni]|uniref:high affinity cationic amino acid transporter 1-like isoform X1 n=2 Tax=Dermacentor andersoni TaxID=34620 RepID=UPI00215545E8|nr:high affinity cationic amino acid transporter 1-like isoform X1 [Dermacentor andersoni]
MQTDGQNAAVHQDTGARDGNMATPENSEVASEGSRSSDMADSGKSFLSALIRRKRVGADVAEASQLNRCLSTFDLTLLGVGGTLGLGIYVLAGQVASTKAGPAVVLSFLVAAVASVFSGLCYAEFGSRVPRAGSAYVYSYVTVGELMAFIIGWNLILEYIIGTASVARGYSGYLDSLLNRTMETHMRQWMPISVSWLSSYPDLFALGITLILAMMLAIGVKESTRFNNLFTGLNLLVVLYVVIAGSFKADVANWQLKPSDVPSGHGKGGFFPYGVGGVLNGAASCFYGFVGFDVIATMGEEVRNPRRAIPIGIVLSLGIVFLAYFGVSIIETLLWPYYAQNVSAPLPFVFQEIGWPVAKWIITIGALAGLSTSLLGGMFPLPRVLYAMGSDGLIFRFLAIVHPRLKTPLIATAVSGVFAGVMAMIFNVEELANMMSIGTLLAYSLVAISVLMLRYEPLSPQSIASAEPSLSVSISNRRRMYDVTRPSDGDADAADSRKQADDQKARSIITTLFNLDGLLSPTETTSFIVKILTLVVGALFMALTALLVFAEDEVLSLATSALVPLVLMSLVSIFCIACIMRQPSASTETLAFAVPLVPIIPLINTFINLYLMMRLPLATWARFGIWMAVGMLIYFGYGIWNSSQRKASPPILDEAAGSVESSSSDHHSEDEAASPSAGTRH